MIEQPDAYWDEVNRNYYELLNNAPYSFQGGFARSREGYSYNWLAREENVRAEAAHLTYLALGRIAVATIDCLALRRHVIGTGIATDRYIIFSPDQRRINRVQVEVKNPSKPLSTSPYAKDPRALRRTRKAGLLDPTEKDYELLREELRRGVAFKRYDPKSPYRKD